MTCTNCIITSITVDSYFHSWSLMRKKKKERCHQDTLPRILYICDSDKSYSFTKSDTGLPAL